MPAIGLLLFLIDAVLIVHAARSGRFWPWAYVVLMLPGFGAAAYVLLELLPEWRGSASGRKAQSRIVKTLDPGRRYRALHDALETADTIANRAALAEECLALGKNEEALSLYDSITSQPHGEEAIFFVGKARAALALEKPADALGTLDDLKRRWPDYDQSSAHLPYARALQGAGRSEEAIHEYQALADRYPGPEPLVRLAGLLKDEGREAEARAIAENVVKRLERSPKFVRKQQAEWFTAARALLNG